MTNITSPQFVPRWDTLFQEPGLLSQGLDNFDNKEADSTYFRLNAIPQLCRCSRKAARDNT